MISVECVFDTDSDLGESAHWDAENGLLWWLDIKRKVIYRFNPVTRETASWGAPLRLGALARRSKGGLVVTMADGFHFFDPATSVFTPITDPEAHIPANRFNDGKTDRQGRFWCGSLVEDRSVPDQLGGALYRLDVDGQVTKIVTGIGCSNGLAWSPDSRSMYFCDSRVGVIWAYDFDPVTGDVENRRDFIDLASQGLTGDGATVDADGCYWVTIPRGSQVHRYDPAGRLMTSIDMPTDVPTCCEFGGADLTTLYVTTATLGRNKDELKGQRHAGALFALDVGVKGLTMPAYAG